ncbi:MAG: hypothetical protein A2Y62_21305 [Candidatus Fischerbacteria bacterium RBG_13_37_8]|uniref:ParB-like N-terminal domain-containing protein n=1 Tax=Candidatus Fischerbacteria bacterium RBG_13_37_8 TaxID=1817863 RepID=A0A1F5VNZ4_9BACT|nr:MAG: hypothetical protein A2Y62_21305 [Candidatus Fischerbacteria bacterium RBG_13_37_8]
MFVKYLNWRDIDSSDDSFFIKNSNDYSSLLNSISTFGLSHPLKLYHQKNRYIIISGYKRFRCLVLLNYSNIPCLVYESELFTENDIMKIALFDNNNREFSEFEKAVLINKMKTYYDPNDAFFKYALEFIVKVSKNEIEYYDKLFNLPLVVLEALHHDKLKQYHLKWLINLNPEEQIFFHHIITSMHFTKSQFHEFVHLIDTICRIWDIPNRMMLFSLSTLKKLINIPVEAEKIAVDDLLRHLKIYAYPILSLAENNMNRMFSEVLKSGIAITYPRYIEGNTIKITIEANSFSDLESKLNHMNSNLFNSSIAKIFHYAKKNFII